MENLDGYLAADGIELSDDVLNSIDEIVPPRLTINVVDNMWEVGTTVLGTTFRRRQTPRWARILHRKVTDLDVLGSEQAPFSDAVGALARPEGPAKTVVKVTT